MATKYEYYDTGTDATKTIWGTRWGAQTFTPSTAHTIKSVKLHLDRTGLPGTVIVGIRATSANKPTGGDLVSGTTDGDTLLTTKTWREITFGLGVYLEASTKYAIVIRAPTADYDTGKYVGWSDTTSGTYAGGDRLDSLDSGAIWEITTGQDQYFEEYGADTPIVTTEACTAITGTTATGNGTITDLGGSAVTEHGHCWSLTSPPTTADSKTTLGTGSLGAFTSSITGLTAGLKYYVRAYATNTSGTSYGQIVSFTAAAPSSQMGDGRLAVKGATLRYIGYDGIEYYLQGTAV